MRSPTPVEEVKAWQRLAFDLNFKRTISLDEQGVYASLRDIDSWVHAHSTANGERPDSEVKKNVAEAFWKYIAKEAPPAKVKRKTGIL